jgi:hypothetical protein
MHDSRSIGIAERISQLAAALSQAVPSFTKDFAKTVSRRELLVTQRSEETLTAIRLANSFIGR